MKSLLGMVLVIALLLPRTSIAHSRPNPVLEVSPQTLSALVSRGNFATERILLAENADPKTEAQKKADEKQKTGTPEESPPPRRSGGVYSGVGVGWGGSGGNRESALLVFAVVGLVMVIAWIPYFPILLYDVLKGNKDDYDLYQMGTFEASPLIGNTTRQGGLYSGRYSLFIDEKKAPSTIRKGFSAEAGHYLIKEKNRNQDEVRNEGLFWLLGPSLLYGEDRVFGKLDLLGGTSFDRRLGLVSKADVSVNWKIGSTFTLGFGVGALYLHVKDRQGLLSHTNDLGMTVGLRTGFTF